MSKVFIGKCKECSAIISAMVDGHKGVEESVSLMVRGGLAVSYVDLPVSVSPCICVKQRVG